MEVNGHISFLPYAKYKTLTPNDMGINVKGNGLCANVIIDGKIMCKNLKNVHKDEKWLLHNLEALGFNDPKKIFLCTIDTNEKLNVYTINNSVKYNDIFE